MDNQDIINPQNSFNKLATLTLPKGTLTLLPPERWNLPMMAFSYGEAFHTEDPRIGNGTGQPTLLSRSRAYQLVFSKVVKQTQLNVTLRHVSNSQELAKIDPDTGLQQIVGASLNKVKAEPLGVSFTGVPVREIRGSVLRPFLENCMSIGVSFLLASGYTGPTRETLVAPTVPPPFERIVAVPLKSYASLSWTYYFKK